MVDYLCFARKRREPEGSAAATAYVVARECE
jgi:hypothetical protein